MAKYYPSKPDIFLSKLADLAEKYGQQVCWPWPRLDNRGYGRFGSKSELAHRLAFGMCVEPIPKGMHVCHTCDSPSCVNPNHLFLGYDIDNARDKIKKGRENNSGLRHPHMLSDDQKSIFFARCGQRPKRRMGRTEWAEGLSLEFGLNTQYILHLSRKVQRIGDRENDN